jgi:hypothetical protein
MKVAFTDEEPITEEWLKSVGFKWHEFERQNAKHWLLWLGGGLREKPCLSDVQDIGIELSPSYSYEDQWFCWLRSDAAGRYHRFIHLRHVSTRGDVIGLIEAISGRPWTPENHFYGALRSPEAAERIRQDNERLDRRLLAEGPKWFDVEEDDSRGRALPEHMTAAIKGGGAK